MVFTPSIARPFVLMLGFSRVLAAFALDLDPQISADFEGGSIGVVETVAKDTFQLQVPGQVNSEGRNRQATWYAFRLDHVRGRELTLVLGGFVGEYNGKSACPMSAQLRPVYSEDGQRWTHFEAMDWDDQRKEATLRICPTSETLYVAHVPPYPWSRLNRLLGELSGQAFLRSRTIGSSVDGRDLKQLTVTDFSVPSERKKCVWLQTRQHAWEAGTSWVMEGALRFITSNHPQAEALRRRVIFEFTPTLDPDGCAQGGVRFNRNGFDLNRHWDAVDLKDRLWLSRLPEVWHAKTAITKFHEREHPVELMINIHNTETAEYMESCVDEERESAALIRVFQGLVARTDFAPTRPRIDFVPSSGGTANDLWRSHRVPVALMELRISANPKTGRFPTVEDRLRFGEALVGEMARAVLPAE